MIVKLQYHCEELKTSQQFMSIHNWSLINSDNLMDEIKINDKLNRIFLITAPDPISSILVKDIYGIIEHSALSRIIQRRKKEDYQLQQDTIYII